jgi:HK97 family phage prohead protease
MEGMIEKRDMPFEDEGELVIETRADGRPVIKGYAVVYNRLSVDLGGFRERIMPGAFDAVLNRQRGRGDLVSYYNHNPDILLGRESSGTLEVFSDEKGVGYIVTPPATRADIVELVQRRDVKGSSFTFSVDKGGEAFVTDETGRAIRLETNAPLDLVVVWTEPPRPMVCLEPWTAPRGSLASGERRLELQPGEQLELNCCYRLESS